MGAWPQYPRTVNYLSVLLSLVPSGQPLGIQVFTVGRGEN